MKAILPRPLQSLTIMATWLLAQMSVSPGNLLMGAFVGIVIPLWVKRFWPNAPRVQNMGKLIKYIMVFLWDVLVANIQVALWILGPKDKLRPRFLYVPLEVTHPFTITTFAATISLTPGTVSSHISGDHRLLIVHCLHTDDDDKTVREIKDRYEKPLLEIFGC